MWGIWIFENQISDGPGTIQSNCDVNESKAALIPEERRETGNDGDHMKGGFEMSIS